MGIYDQGGSGGFELPQLPLQKIFLIIVAVVVILGLAYWSYQSVFTQKAISAHFAQENWSLIPSDSMLLSVSITNTTGELVRESVVRVKPVDFDSINVFPPSQKLPTIENGNNRDISFVLRTNKPFDQFVSGTYSFTIEWVVNNVVVDQQTISIPITKSVNN